jgi:anaerobic selenocysteine-containing dehydrogenase
MDCPDTCSILALQNGNTARLYGDGDNPITRGYLCAKMRKFPERLAGSPTRLKSPRFRTSNGWEDISWEKAFDLITGRMKAARDAGRTEEIILIHGSGSHGVLKRITEYFFRRFGATALSTDLCSPAARAAQALSFGYRPCHDPRDVLNAGTIWMWGRNPHVTNSHFIPIISEARKKGTRFVVVDVQKTASANVADRFFQVRPDGDWAMIAGMIRVLIEEGLYDSRFCDEKTHNFDEFKKIILALDPVELARTCGLTNNEIADAAKLFMEKPPTSLWFGWGLQHGKNACENVRMADALGAVSGNIGIVGGGVNHGQDEHEYFNTSIIECEAKRSIASVELGGALNGSLEPPLRAGFVFGANPAASWPDLDAVRKGLEALDFLVVVDREMTETAKRATLVLPTTCFLEENDLMGSYFHNWVGRINQVIPQPENVKSDLEIVSELAARLEIELEGDPEKWIAKFLDGSGKHGITAKALQTGPVEANDSQVIPLADGIFPTPSGKFEFPAELPKPDETEKHELMLVTDHSSKWINTAGREDDYEGNVKARISPAEAVGLGISDGDRILIESNHGSIEAEISVAERIGEGIINIQTGGAAAGFHGVNLLTNGKQTTAGQGPVFNAITVRVRRLQDEGE